MKEIKYINVKFQNSLYNFRRQKKMTRVHETRSGDDELSDLYLEIFFSTFDNFFDELVATTGL